MKKIVVVLSLTPAFLTYAIATPDVTPSDVSVRRLYQKCTAPTDSDPLALPYCIGKVEGITELLELNHIIAKKIRPGFGGSEMICLPKTGTSNGDRVKIFINWVRNNPDELDNLDVVGVIKAFQEAWPCGSSN